MAAISSMRLSKVSLLKVESAMIVLDSQERRFRNVNYPHDLYTTFHTITSGCIIDEMINELGRRNELKWSGKTRQYGPELPQ